MLVGEIFGPDLLIVVLVGAIVLFGGSAIPKLARNLGQTKTEFEKGMRSAKEVAGAVSTSPFASGPSGRDSTTSFE